MLVPVLVACLSIENQIIDHTKKSSLLQFFSLLLDKHHIPCSCKIKINLKLESCKGEIDKCVLNGGNAALFAGMYSLYKSRSWCQVILFVFYYLIWVIGLKCSIDHYKLILCLSFISYLFVWPRSWLKRINTCTAVLIVFRVQ